MVKFQFIVFYYTFLGHTNQSNHNRLRYISPILVQEFQHIFSRKKQEKEIIPSFRKYAFYATGTLIISIRISNTNNL